ncbi:MAG TPA: hypothetical protein VGQ27_00400 [Steroidobacteraceae bacterium]|jgi:hypothetical protein|nr:hypothetical protein [Steroidobacteraceae bacterium]
MFEIVVFRLIGFFAGVFPIALGLLFGPLPKYDPQGWGSCRMDSFYPVMAPERPPTVSIPGLAAASECFDCYVCVFGPIHIALSIVVSGALFTLSGVLTVRAGRSRSTIFGLAPAAITLTLILGWLPVGRDYLPLATALLGGGILVSAIGLAALGAHLATRDE